MKTVLCFGDSNTNGCNPAFDIRNWEPDWEEKGPVRYPREVRWTGVLAEMLGPEYYVIEEGLPGRTTMYEDPTSPYRKGSDYIVPCMQTHAPIDLLVVMLGTNDVKAMFTPSEPTIGAGLEEFMRIIKNPALWDGKNNGKILLVAPPPIGEQISTSPFYGMFDETSVRVSKKFDRIYKGVARVMECEYLNAGEYIQSSPLDSIHFSKEDHQKLAEAMCKKIKELF